MQNMLKLKNPIMVNNAQVTELTYDSNEITAALYTEADTKRRISAGTRNVSIVPAAEFDFSLHPWIGMAAVIAVNPGYSFEDLERVKGADMLELSKIGRDFILGVEESSPDSSDEHKGTIPDSSTPLSLNSNDGD